MWEKAVRRFPLLLIITIMLTACGAKPGDGELKRLEQSTPLEDMIENTISERTVKNNVYLNDINIGNMKESQVRGAIEDYALKTDIQPVDAVLNSKTWEVTRGKVGKKVNIEKTLDNVLNAGEGARVKMVVEEVNPAVTSDMLVKNIVVVGNYTTHFLNRGESRVNNIQVASEKIDFLKLAPGEEFSFNRTVGRRTEAKGYEEAPIIIKTEDGPKKGYGVGGGVCQISTTLYNAVEEAGLEVLERHVHSKDIGYVPRGEDATVSYGSADFRFRNSRGHPIMIRLYAGSKALTAKIIENRGQ